ncbi:RloB family protein [Photobacterium ganghwense]|uniref:RloB family protein n=1 Tax=Photobacterium ganghwense TaxID=320778 RepID=UPI001C2D2AAB|nr:RloB family protein [Photobacterium ganghwense]MBV1843462.1 RloB family protein [Photobacterium ganghwense]
MGSDDLFKKRKERKKEELKRKGSKRKPYERVLIVSEGSKTEPNYFLGAKNHFKIDSANIHIDKTSESSPKSIVQCAIKLFNQEKDINPYDKVLCVFDRDTHESFDEAILTISNKNKSLKKDVFLAITTNPAFEFWLLLHYVYTTKSYHPLPGKSVGKQVEDDLKVYLPDYKKTDPDIFEKHLDMLEGALKVAKSVNRSTDNGNPSTKMDVAINYLKNIKEIQPA